MKSAWGTAIGNSSCLKRAVKAASRVSESLSQPRSRLDTAIPQAGPEPGAGRPRQAAGPKRALLLVSHQAETQFHKSQPAH